MSKDVKVYISCHKPTDVLRTEVFQPIEVGTALHRTPLPGMLQDNTGENISTLNPMYCELTAQYWAWKNRGMVDSDADSDAAASSTENSGREHEDGPDYYGFCHYRRYFNLSDQIFEEDPYGNIIEPYLDQEVVDRYQLKDDRVRELVGQYDIIVTERKLISSIRDAGSTPREQYRNARLLHYEDFERMLKIIDERHPSYSRAARKFADGERSCYCNMYILRKDLFFEYCEFVFDVLGEFCRETDMSHYSTEALRTPGHLSERLFNIFLIHVQEEHPELRVKEVQCVQILHTDPQPEVLEPAFAGREGELLSIESQSRGKSRENAEAVPDAGRVVPVVFAANNAFVPMFAACFLSMLDHISEDHLYDVVLIESDVTAENQQTLLQMIAEHPNVSLRFYDPGRLLKNYHLEGKNHITVETYYRFLIQTALQDYDKVLYLDCDTIIKADVAELYQTDMTGYMLAAVRDVDFLGQIGGYNPSTIEYCKEEFPMKDPFQYFQAGVILFNEAEMRKAHSLDEWLTFATIPYRYSDQDVLNLHCEGRVKYLDMSWNVLTDCDHTRIKNVIVCAPDSIQKEYQEARKHPKIIHYAGFRKPWHRPTEDFAHEFWLTLRRTPYYEELLYRMNEGQDWEIGDRIHGDVRNEIRNESDRVLDGESTRWEVHRREWKSRNRLHRRILNALMPVGSRRRQRLDALYVHLFRRSAADQCGNTSVYDQNKEET